MRLKGNEKVTGIKRPASQSSSSSDHKKKKNSKNLSSTCSKLEGIVIASSSSDDQVNNNKESEVRRELLRERRTSGLSERSYVSDNISGEERVEEWSEGSGSIFFSSESKMPALA